MSDSNIESTGSISPLLRLPLELRRLIYAFTLPFATTLPELKVAPKGFEYMHHEVRWVVLDGHSKLPSRIGHNVIWTRGCTALLAVSKQVHEETTAMLYGDNIFVVDVRFDAIDFYLSWLTAKNLTPNRTYSFLEHFSQRNLLRIKHYVVNVELVDEYTGMIKYNCGGQGLPAGIVAQVSRLVKLMASVEALQSVQINLRHSSPKTTQSTKSQVANHLAQEAKARAILAPFERLRGVRKVKTTGISEKHVEDLRRRMTAPKSEQVIAECN